MITLIVQLLFLTGLFFICIRYDLGKSFKKSLSRAILVGLMIGIIYIVLHQPSREGIVAYDCSTSDPLTFGAKTSGTDTFGGKTSGTDTFGAKTSGTDTFGAKTSGTDTFGAKTSGTDTFGDKVRNGYNHENLFKTIINKAYHTTLTMDKKWQDNNNYFSICK